MARVWPDLIAKMGSLRFHIASLGEGPRPMVNSGVRLRTNVAGRGSASWTLGARSHACIARAALQNRTAKLHARVARMVDATKPSKRFPNTAGQRFGRSSDRAARQDDRGRIGVAHCKFLGV